MKTSYRCFIAIIAGAAFGAFFPIGDRVGSVFSLSAEIVLKAGHFVLWPMVFFSFPIAVTQLRRAKKLGAMLRHLVIFAVAAGAFMAVLGSVAAWSLNFLRIPALPGIVSDSRVPGLLDLLGEIFQGNILRVFVSSPEFILPSLVLAFLIGWHLHFDKEAAEPAYNLFDSLSRIFYRINRYIFVLMPLFFFVLTANSVLNSRMIVDFQRFVPMIVSLSAVTVILVVGVFPFILHRFFGWRLSWKIFSGIFGALVGAFVSGSLMFNYGYLTIRLNEKLLVPRKNAAFSAPLLTIFSRSGTALIAAFAMLTVIRSYSSLEITLYQMAWTALFAFLTSFVLSAAPQNALVLALGILGSLYGRGLENGWLILVPVLPILTMLATLIDTTVAAAIIVIANREEV